MWLLVNLLFSVPLLPSSPSQIIVPLTADTVDDQRCCCIQLESSNS